jgi:hypothetical protein
MFPRFFFGADNTPVISLGKIGTRFVAMQDARRQRTHAKRKRLVCKLACAA